MIQNPTIWDSPLYKWKLLQIYNLLLQGETVVSCKKVMHNGKHVMGMYDIEITNPNTHHLDHDSYGRSDTTTIRLRPTESSEWDTNGFLGE